jgi:hypothetical protein
MRLRTLPVVLSALAPLALAGPSFGLAHLSAPSVDGAQETPPNASPGSGVAHTLIDTSTNTLYYHIEFGGLLGVENNAHIHGYAPAGTPAGVVHPLPLGSPKIGAWVYPEANEAQILAGLTYVNIHSTMFGGGEIRGQLVVDPATDLVAICNGAQETPPVASSGQGIAAFDIDTAANTLDYVIYFGNLTGVENNAHIHGYAAPGTPAGVVHPLPLGNPKIGTWNFGAADEPNILAGLAYVNIHSTFAGGGEIRGQILPMNPATGVEVLGADSGTLSLTAAPNPVPNGTTVALLYRLPSPDEISVTVHDVTGRVVRRLNPVESDGAGILAWDTRDQAGTPVSAGVYFARLAGADGQQQTRRIVVLR